MKHLLVLCGPIGCGKTTLIQNYLKQFPDCKFFDVFDYILKYKDATGHIDEPNTLRAYQEMYRDLGNSPAEKIVLELGTNWAELNIKNLKNLNATYKVNIIFCLLDKEECIRRSLARAQTDPLRIINPTDLEKKFKRIFPDNHIKLTQDYQLPYLLLDMNIPQPEKLTILINNL
jgi:predicted kinase